jgi:hypothetical protein
MRTISVLFLTAIALHTYAQTSSRLTLSPHSIDSSAILEEADLACFYYPLSPHCRAFAPDNLKSITTESSDPNGPRCLLIEPTEELVSIPTLLKLNFISNDSEIDLSSITIRISKKFMSSFLPSLDVTSRVRPYISSKGVYWENATLPKGEYKITLLMRDLLGRQSQTIFSIKSKG